MSANDRQEGGGHYKKFSKFQPWDIVIYFKLNFLVGNAVKYLLRYEHKGNPLEDLKKAVHYIEKEIERLQALPGQELDGTVKFLTCDKCTSKGECIQMKRCDLSLNMWACTGGYLYASYEKGGVGIARCSVCHLTKEEHSK